MSVTSERVVQIGLPFSLKDQEQLVLPERVRLLQEFIRDIRDYYGTPYLLTEHGDRLRIRESKDGKTIIMNVFDRASQPPEIMQITWSNETETTRTFYRAVFGQKDQVIFWTTFGRKRLVPEDVRWLDRLLSAWIRSESHHTMQDIEARIMDSFFFLTTTTRQDILELHRREQGDWLFFPNSSFLFRLAKRQFQQGHITEDHFNRVEGLRRWVDREEACISMRQFLVKPQWIPWSG